MTPTDRDRGFQDWGELRDYAIGLFNETPHPQTETEIIDAYEIHPDQVHAAILSIAADVAAGTARSGWGVLRSRCGRIKTPVANPTYDNSRSREKTIQRAEQWMHAAGLHFDLEDELTDELFGDFGRLRAYHDNNLEQRMVNLWRELRPKGEAIEADAIKRADEWKKQRRRAHLAAVPAPEDMPI